MHTHDICAYTAVQLKVDKVNVVPFGKVFLCVVLCDICTCYVVVYTCEHLYVHMCVHVCMHTHGCRGQRLTCGVFPQSFSPLFETRSLTKPEPVRLCQTGHRTSWIPLTLFLHCRVTGYCVQPGNSQDGRMFTLDSQFQKHSCQLEHHQRQHFLQGRRRGSKAFRGQGGQKPFPRAV